MNKFALIHTISSSARVEKEASYEMRRQARREENQRLAVEADLTADKRRTRLSRLQLPPDMIHAVNAIKINSALTWGDIAAALGITALEARRIFVEGETVTRTVYSKIQNIIESPPESLRKYVSVPSGYRERLRTIRVAKGYNWEQMGISIGMPYSTLQTLARTRNSKILVSHLNLIDKFLDKHAN